MKAIPLFISYGTGVLQRSLTDAMQPRVAAILGTTLELSITFLDDAGAAMELDTGSTGRLVCRSPDALDGATVLLDSSWDHTTATKLYTLKTLADSEQLRGLIKSKPCYTLAAQIEFTIPGEDDPRKSLTFDLIIANSAARGDEGAPDVAGTATWDWFKARLLAGDNVAFTTDDVLRTIEISASFSGAGTGDVVGPNAATDNAIARYDSTTGKLIQNSGITIADGASGTLSGTNTGDQSTFSTIAVAGQSNVVADSTGDTLTFVAGSNVTITTDAATDSVTISATGGGGGSAWGGITGTLSDQTDLQTALNGKASTTHAASHTNGTDDIQSATASQKGLATAAQITKLDGIEALADVTDAANVGSSIAGATAVTTLDDTDVLPIVTATPTLKKLAYSAFKTLLDALYQAKATILSTFSGLADDAGVLTNDGSGGLFYTGVSFGGAGSADSTKLVRYNSFGEITSSKYIYVLGDSTNLTTIEAQTGVNAGVILPAVNGTLAVTDQLTVSNLSGFGTGVADALAINTGSAGAPVLYNGALGTPSSGTATNLSGTASGLTAGSATAALGIKTASTTVSVSSATAPTSGQVLTATSSTAATWQTPSAGSGGAVVAVKSAIKTDTQSLAASTWTDVTGLSVTYTPTSASNKILVVASVQGGCSAASCAVAFRLVRDSTAIGVADAASNRIQAGAVNYPVQDGLLTTAAMAVLDSPATTASTVYKVQFRRFYDSGSGTVYVNRSHSDTDATNYARGASTITIYEVTP